MRVSYNELEITTSRSKPKQCSANLPIVFPNTKVNLKQTFS